MILLSPSKGGITNTMVLIIIRLYHILKRKSSEILAFLFFLFFKCFPLVTKVFVTGEKCDFSFVLGMTYKNNAPIPNFGGRPPENCSAGVWHKPCICNRYANMKRYFAYLTLHRNNRAYIVFE